MNESKKDNDVELLDLTTSIPVLDDDVNKTSDVPIPEVPSGMSASYGENVSVKKEEKPSYVSPLASKPMITGTTANSPRISADVTMVNTNKVPQGTPQVPKSIQKVETPSNDLLDNSNGGNGDTNGSNNNNNKMKPSVLIVVFIIILLAVFLLPYGSALLENIFKSDDETYQEEVLSGDLVCRIERETDSNSYQYTETYTFVDNEINTLEHEILIQGDVDYLRNKNSECEGIKQNATGIEGVRVNCELSSDEMRENQFFNLANLNLEQLTPAFMEAGGIYPNAKYKDDYKEVQTSLELSGYECEIQ